MKTFNIENVTGKNSRAMSFADGLTSYRILDTLLYGPGTIVLDESLEAGKTAQIVEIRRFELYSENSPDTEPYTTFDLQVPSDVSAQEAFVKALIVAKNQILEKLASGNIPDEQVLVLTHAVESIKKELNSIYGG